MPKGFEFGPNQFRGPGRTRPSSLGCWNLDPQHASQLVRVETGSPMLDLLENVGFAWWILKVLHIWTIDVEASNLNHRPRWTGTITTNFEDAS